ncbi:40S ribosomal protein S5-1 [Hordeum vulgare]|nr:40S ribosomal protein S5-1 [Hordeum vulgare]
MREGMLHIRDVEGPKKTGSVETRLEAMEQQVFKSQGMVERGLNANHVMITEFTNKHMIDANDIGKHLSRIYDRIDQLQAQIYDLQNQNYIQERFKRQTIRELKAVNHKRHIWKNGGYGCPFYNHKIDNTYSSVLVHARGCAIGSFTQKHSRRMVHATSVEFLENLNNQA